MEAGAEVWVRFEDSEASWVQGRVFSREQKSDSLVEVVVTVTDTNEQLTFSMDDLDKNELDDVKLRNDRSSWDIEDLIHLPHLHEPAILNSLVSGAFPPPSLPLDILSTSLMYYTSLLCIFGKERTI